MSLAIRLGLPIVAAAILGGCGSDEPDEACGILATGTELCGADLKAYCEKFERGSLDRDTVTACANVGAEVLPTTRFPEPDELAQDCISAGGPERACEAWAQSNLSAGVRRISSEAAACLRDGGRVRFCISDYP